VAWLRFWALPTPGHRNKVSTGAVDGYFGRGIAVVAGRMLNLQVFLYLQLLDLLTTIAGLRLGASEASPFVRILMEAGPAYGVLLSKGIAVVLGGMCLYLNKPRLIGWINYWYAGLVVWNFAMIFRALGVQ
jgi:hypothetical protein